MATVDLRDMESKTADPVTPEAPPKAPVGRQIQFGLDYVDPSTGAVQSAQLTARIPTMNEKALIGRRMVYLAGAFKFDDMPGDWQAWAEAYAHVSVRIENPPEWLLQAAAEDNGLLDALWGRLLEHERDYFRADGATGEGAPGKPRVVLR